MKIEVADICKTKYPFLGVFVIILDIKVIKDDFDCEWSRITVLTKNGIEVVTVGSCGSQWFKVI